MRTEILQIDLPLPETLSFKYKSEEILFFDIETTGFSADVTALYLIGIIEGKDDKFVLKQFFSEKKEDEKELLLKFNEAVKEKKLLICYNGSGFDLPYLKKKAETHDLSLDAVKIPLLDLYRELSAFKKVLHLPDLKQKTVEEAIGIKRENDRSGGDLVKVYGEFIKLFYKKEEAAASELYNILTGHNRNDLLGLFTLSSLSSLKGLTDGTAFSEAELCFEKEGEDLFLSLPFQSLLSLHGEKDGIFLSSDKEKRMLFFRLPIVRGELKYFYPDYKEYDYLPKEDRAVHKSLSSFLDKSHREKAKAETCYVKVEGEFIRVPHAEFPEVFKRSYHEKDCFMKLERFLSLPEKESFLTDWIKIFL